MTERRRSVNPHGKAEPKWFGYVILFLFGFFACMALDLVWKTCS